MRIIRVSVIMSFIIFLNFLFYLRWWLMPPLQLFQSAANCSFPLLFFAWTFFCWGSKQASNWTEAGHELCAASWLASLRHRPPPTAHRPPRTTHHRSGPGQGRGGGIVPCRDSFGFPSIFCCPPAGMGAGKAPVPPFCRCASANLFFVLLPFCRPNFSCRAAQFDLRRFLFITVSFKARSVLCLFHQFDFVSFHFIEFSHIRIRTRIQLVGEIVPLVGNVPAFLFCYYSTLE